MLHHVLHPTDDPAIELAARYAAAEQPCAPMRAADGPPAVLYLHGFGSSQDGDKAVAMRQAFGAAGAAFASLDVRGHGASTGALRTLTLTRALADVEIALADLRARGHRRPILFGSSMGGLLALWTAARRPDAVAAVLGLAPAIDMLATLEKRLGPDGMAAWQADGWTTLETTLTRTPMDWPMVEDLRRYDLSALIDALEVPVFLLQGAHDDSVDRSAVIDFALACRPPVELHLFGDGDHRLLDHLAALPALCLTFLRTRGLLAAAPSAAAP
ncbi:MAG: alpha/beta fold hydrolase [Acidobacteriota bacterium]